MLSLKNMLLPNVPATAALVDRPNTKDWVSDFAAAPACFLRAAR
jgi:hypothetical protein